MVTSILLVISTFATIAFGGSRCPPRVSIYPCSCLNVEIKKRVFFTAVTCHRLHDSDALGAIFTSLRSLHIDQFQLYDSFWGANNLGETAESKMVFPPDWLSLLKVKEIEIVDTSLSTQFACGGSLRCRNSETTRFSVLNSSSSESIDALCHIGGRNPYTWTGCLTNLKHFQFSHGKLTSLGDIFPIVMKELIVLNLSYNRISMVNPKAFQKLPKLSKLDLSHNLIGHLEGLFNGVPINTLEFLDVSWNSIKTLGTTLFPSLMKLNFFKADHNRIVHLRKEDWDKIPKSLKKIDLGDNPIHCGCNIRWINSTFRKDVTVIGKCATPREYQSSYLRKASLEVDKRCDENGKFRTKSVSVTTAMI